MKKLLRLLLLVGIIIVIVKAVSAKKEWSGLTEADARAKIDGKLARRVDDLEKRAEIADKVIEQMKTRGMIAPAPVQPVDDVAQAAEEAVAEAATEEPGEPEASDEPSSDAAGDGDASETGSEAADDTAADDTAGDDPASGDTGDGASDGDEESDGEETPA